MPVGLFADGAFRTCESPTGQIERRSPADPDDVIGAFPYAEIDVDVAVDAARRAAPGWAATPLDDRLKALRALKSGFATHRAHLQISLEREGGRPRWEVTREVQALGSRLEFTTSLAKRILDDKTDGRWRRIASRPLGVVAIIGPAMLPLATSHQHIVAALAAGNTVVWKPSPLATASAQRYAEVVAAADLPPGVFNLVSGPGEIGARLATAGVDAVVLVGSTASGEKVRAGLGGDVAVRQIYHLGAKNAAIVTRHAMLELACYEIATSAFMSAGQRCSSLSRVFVEESVCDELVDGLLQVISGFTVGPPAERPFVGPMLSAGRLERFLSAMADAEAAGARAVLPGGQLERGGYFASPSVHVVEPAEGEDPYQDAEHFGPDLAIHPVANLGAAIRASNQSRYGLCSVLFSDDLDEWDRYAAEIEVGIALHNLGTHSISGRLPFGGIKASGQGGRAGLDAIRAMRRQLALQQRDSDVVDLWPGTTRPGGSS
jgi:succinylglutamic semialdehyde dehydrogenase